MKAFSVLHKEDNIGGIYFANHAIAAKKQAADLAGEGDIAGWKVRRCEWADKYAPGPVPYRALIDHGWHTDCDGCGRDISLDCIIEENLVLVEADSGIFCNEACRKQGLADRAERIRMQNEASDWLRAYMSEKHPDAVIVANPIVDIAHPKPGELALRLFHADFSFPGAKFGNAKILFRRIGGEPEYSMPAGDVEAWSLWNAKSPG